MDATPGLDLPESRWVDVGGPVHYRRWPGPRGGRTFVCVHGLGGSLLNWASVADGLARRGPVLAMDLAGFGLTPPEERGTTVGANWRLLDGFIEALDLPPVVLVGNSMGGMLSLIQAAHHPGSVDRLVLVDAAFPRAKALRAQPSPRVSALFATYSTGVVGSWLVNSRTRRLGPDRLVRTTLDLIAADASTIDPVVVDAMVEMTRRRMDFGYSTKAFLEAARSIFRSQVAPEKYRAVVRAVHCPALVIHGGRDPLIPVGAAREAVGEHANWKLVEFEDLGHVPQMEAPARWLDAVTEWLDDGADASAHAEGA